jgi:hypothetical protein
MTNYSIETVKEMIAHWTAQPESAQRTTVLSYWVKQAQGFIYYSRKASQGLIENTGAEVKAATKIVASYFQVPQRKAGESRRSSMVRLTSL